MPPEADGAHRPLRVLINDRALCRTLTGVGNYIVELLAHAEDGGGAADDVRLVPFYNAHLVRRAWRVATVSRGGGGEGVPSLRERHPSDLGDSRLPWWVRRVLQGGYRAAFRWASRRYDLYHEPNHIPLRCDLPTVTTIHDLSVLEHPQWHPPDRVRWYEREFDAGLRQTRRFIAASRFTRGRMAALLGIPPDRVHVTYQAPRKAFRPRGPGAVEPLRAALRLPERFFLFVGTLEPRKNVTGLLDAYAALPQDVRRRHALVIAGAWGWRQRTLRERAETVGLGRQVRTLGYLEDEALARLYSACTALVWPTFYEGLGLPPLEAMACAAPVIVSDVASLPEVVGDAGVRLDPHDASAWTEAMRRMAEDDRHREACAARGPAQAARFTWPEFLLETVAAYRAALAAP